MKKKTLKTDLTFQLKHIDGSEVKTSDKKVHHFSITKLEKRKKGIMSEPIESVIIRAQQNFDVVSGLNPIQIEIKDNTVINIFKKMQECSVQDNTSWASFSSVDKKWHSTDICARKKLNGVKKCILTYKYYDILAAVDLNKIKNLKDVKGKSI